MATAKPTGKRTTKDARPVVASSARDAGRAKAPARKGSSQKATPKPKVTAPVTGSPAPRKSGRPGAGEGKDWEAIERDYRTGRFTDVELAKKHNVARQTILERRKKDEAAGRPWQRDLRDAVRQATSARLVAETLQEAVSNVSDTVAAAARVAADVILGHRQDIRSLRDQAFSLLSELQSANGTMEELRSMLDTLENLEESAIEGDPDMGDAEKERKLKRLQKNFEAIRKMTFEAADIHNRVGSAQKLMDIIVKAQTLERKAFDLDKDTGDSKSTFEDVLDRALA